MVCIYKIISPSDKIYIGRTVDFNNRMGRYKRLACKAQKSLYSSFKKYGFDSHRVYIIYEFPFDVKNEVINAYEELYIDLYKSCGMDLMNLTIGGAGARGVRYNIETKMKMRAASLGKPKSAYTKKQMSLYSKNRPLVHQQKITTKRSLPVIQYTLEGNFIKEWPSLNEANRSGNGDVRGCVEKRQYHAGGFKWYYKHLLPVSVIEDIQNEIALSEKREKERRGKISFSMKKYNNKDFIPGTNYVNL